MAVPKQKTGKKPGTFQKGNKAALGNDKTMRLSTWIDKELDTLVPEDISVDLYTAGMTKRQYLAQRLVLKAMTTDKGDLDYFKEIADRTEGKAMQKVDHTTLGKEMPQPIYGGMSTDE